MHEQWRHSAQENIHLGTYNCIALTQKYFFKLDIGIHKNMDY